MALRNLLFVFLAIYHASALNVEAVVGGKMATPTTFSYAVSVQLQREPNGRYKLVCGGGILKKDLIISVAHCYTHKDGTMKRGSFSVIAGAVDLNQENITRIHVDKIYLPGFEEDYNYFNLALLRLRESLDLSNKQYLSALIIPPSFENFIGKTAVLGGYGYQSAEGTPMHNPKLINLQGSPSDHLKYINVTILSDKECKEMYEETSMVNNLCGRALPRRPMTASGLCLGDGGSPLVIGKKIIGLASRTTIDCDNTKISGVYTKVSSFIFFIRQIMKDLVPFHTIVLDNTIF